MHVQTKVSNPASFAGAGLHTGEAVEYVKYETGHGPAEHDLASLTTAVFEHREHCLVKWFQPAEAGKAKSERTNPSQARPRRLQLWCWAEESWRGPSCYNCNSFSMGTCCCRPTELYYTWYVSTITKASWPLFLANSCSSQVVKIAWSLEPIFATKLATTTLKVIIAIIVNTE